jgi:mRNA interferase MazF
VSLDPVRGHEQAGTRPVLVLSTDTFNRGPADLAVVVPLTRTRSGIRFHVPVSPPEGGLSDHSYIKCENIRLVSISARFRDYLGTVSAATMAAVEDRIRILLGL